jgi:hypothetical protein
MARWVDDAQPFAFGILGLRPWELRRYTLREFGYLVEGWHRQEERNRYRTAELACWLLAPWTQKGTRLTPKDLLGTERREDL